MNGSNTHASWQVDINAMDKSAQLHVEGREPKLVSVNWQWQTINLKPLPPNPN